jgi:hypothetical protein
MGQGAYDSFDFFALPSLPLELHGDWNWLRASRLVDRSIAKEKRRANVKALRSLKAEVAGVGPTLPDSFTRFLSEPDLAERVRSNTCCYLDVSDGLPTSLVARGYLVRFLTIMAPNRGRRVSTRTNWRKAQSFAIRRISRSQRSRSKRSCVVFGSRTKSGLPRTKGAGNSGDRMTGDLRLYVWRKAQCGI